VAPRYFTTGHSLGGGLAQHVLYSYPTRIVQAFAFDPSSATGFVGQTVENQIAACSCDPSVADGEPRIYRVYDAYEILSNLRIFHKIVFPPERHVQEVRFPHKRSHSMLGLTEYLNSNANQERDKQFPWFRGVGEFSPGVSCTDAFIGGQRSSCIVPVTRDSWTKCPQ
jgi:pimeloyl-ACP methyl ester carboxylesterase